MKHKHGFTLMEIMTVVIIISVLTAVVLPQYRRAVQKAQASEAIAMLRVINDSAERLAAEFGYRTFQAFSTAEATKAVFQRLDMFDNSTIKCSFTAVTMTCEHFTYYLNQGGDYVYARKNGEPFAGTEFRLYREDIPRLECANNAAACELYNLPVAEEAS